MKKFLSIVLALTMMLTTLALPISVSALELDDDTLAVTFAAFTDVACETPVSAAVKRGDTIYVKASVPAGVTLTEVQFGFKLDDTYFTVGNVAGIEQIEEDCYEFYATNVNGLSADLFVLPLTVTNAALYGATSIGEKDPIGECVFVNDEGDWYKAANVNVTVANISIAAHDVTITFDPGAAEDVITLTDATDNKIIRSVAEGAAVLNVTVENDAEAVVTVNEVAVDELPYTIEDWGNYTVSVQVAGEPKITRTINYRSNLSASLELDAPDLSAGVEVGGTFAVPVKITGLGEDKASMVSFTVTYDADMLTLTNATDAGANITVSGDAGAKTITYGATGLDAEYALANEATVATLAFTANADTIGSTTYSVSGQTLVVVADYVTTNSTIATTPIEKEVTIIKTNFAVADTSVRTDWFDASVDPEATNAYSVPVSSTVSGDYTINYTDVSIVSDPDTQTQLGLAAIFGEGDEVPVGGVPINAEKNYYVVAKIGSETAPVYQLVATLENGVNVFFDGSAPVITLPENMTEWAAWTEGYSVAVSTADENGSGVVSTTAKIGEADAAIEDDAIAISVGTYNNVTLTVTATDKSGNTATKTMNLMIDGEAPSITDVTVGELHDNTRTVTYAAAEVNDGSDIATEVYYFSETKVDNFDPATAEGSPVTIADHTFVAETAGYYYIVVTDAVGNKAIAEAKVELGITAQLPTLEVKVVKTAENYVADPFLTSAEFDAIAGLANKTNGTFTFVEIKEPAVRAGYTNEYKLNGEAITFEEGKYAIEAAEEAATYTLTISQYKTLDAEDKIEEAYSFTVAATVPSVNADGKFNMIDYAVMRRVGAQGFADYADEFAGGYFAGDVDGNLSVTNSDAADDADAILEQIRSGKRTSAYVFDIMNK